MEKNPVCVEKNPVKMEKNIAWIRTPGSIKANLGSVIGTGKLPELFEKSDYSEPNLYYISFRLGWIVIGFLKCLNNEFNKL